MENSLEQILTSFRPCPANDSLFITFEGIEGAGKSTQIELLKTHFEKQDKQVHILREPGGTKFGEKLREAILKQESPLHPLAEAYLFASARAQLMYETVLPLLAKPNQMILCDRFIDSSLAYQGIGRAMGLNTILNIHQYEPLVFFPHLTFYLHIDLETSWRRQEQRNQNKDYFEAESKPFYEKLIQGYDQSLKLFPDRITRIDAGQSVDVIHKQIIELVENHGR